MESQNTHIFAQAQTSEGSNTIYSVHFIVRMRVSTCVWKHGSVVVFGVVNPVAIAATADLVTHYVVSHSQFGLEVSQSELIIQRWLQ